MCDVITGEEQTLDFPSALFTQKHGFSIDFGQSGVKMVYSTDEGDSVRFHFIIYPRERKDEAFAHLADKIRNKIDPETVIYLTGYGCAENLKILQQNMHQKIEVEWEAGFLVRGFQFLLANMPLDEVIFPPSPKALQYATHYSNQVKRRFHQFSEGEHVVEECAGVVQDLPDKQNLYPCMLLLLGSTAAGLMVNEDGTMSGVGCSSPACGRALLGQGSLMTGAKNFEEFMELAKEGDFRKVDNVTSSIHLEGTVYAKLLRNETIDRTLNHFGQAVGKTLGDFEPADLAATLVKQTADCLASYTHQAALLCDTKRVFVFGSLPANSYHFREEFESAFRVRAETLQHATFKPDLYILKFGAFFGCLGALLKGLQEK